MAQSVQPPLLTPKFITKDHLSLLLESMSLFSLYEFNSFWLKNAAML